jgi:hypothetical protein
MLKILFGLLLAINGGLIAFQQGWLDTLLPASREPSRMAQQLHPEQLTLVSLPDSKPATTPVPVSTPVAVVVEPTSAAAPVATSCVEVGNFDAAEGQRFESRLASLSLGDRLTRKPIPDNTRHIVYIPPLANKEAAERKATELRQFGIEDFFIIQDNSPLQWGISLGVFKTEEAARNHLAALNKKGVRSAKSGLGGNRVAFQMRGIDSVAKNSIDKIRADFPRQQLRDCS